MHEMPGAPDPHIGCVPQITGVSTSVCDRIARCANAHRGQKCNAFPLWTTNNHPWSAFSGSCPSSSRPGSATGSGTVTPHPAPSHRIHRPSASRLIAPRLSAPLPLPSGSVYSGHVPLTSTKRRIMRKAAESDRPGRGVPDAKQPRPEQNRAKSSRGSGGGQQPFACCPDGGLHAIGYAQFVNDMLDV